jgi:hypothetical protein
VLGGSSVLWAAGVAAEAAIDALTPIKDVVAAGGGVLGGSSVLRAARVAVEEAVDLHADVTGESHVGAAAADLVLQLLPLAVLVLWLLLRFHWRGSLAAERPFRRHLLEGRRAREERGLGGESLGGIDVDRFWKMKSKPR